MKWNIVCTWKVRYQFPLEAETLEEAIKSIGTTLNKTINYRMEDIQPVQGTFEVYTTACYSDPDNQIQRGVVFKEEK